MMTNHRDKSVKEAAQIVSSSTTPYSIRLYMQFSNSRKFSTIGVRELLGCISFFLG